MSDTQTTQLPPGVHPRDPSGADWKPPTSEKETSWTPGRKAWDTENDEALGVYQRAAHDWDAQLWVLTQTEQIAGRLKGRVALVLAVPTTLPDGSAPNGVIIGSSGGPVDQAFSSGVGDVYVLNAGDSLTLRTEASVYASPIKGNSTGAVQTINLYNPPGGGLGAT
jgi:hypothetical protein